MAPRRRSPTSRSDEDRRAQFRTEFGAALAVNLAQRRMTQLDLARSVGTSRSYTNQTMSGRKGASPQWVNLVAESLGLSAEERVKLHTAAARDAGYDVPEG